MLILFLWHDEGTLHSECEDTGDFVSIRFQRFINGWMEIYLSEILRYKYY